MDSLMLISLKSSRLVLSSGIGDKLLQSRGKRLPAGNKRLGSVSRRPLSILPESVFLFRSWPAF